MLRVGQFLGLKPPGTPGLSHQASSAEKKPSTEHGISPGQKTEARHRISLGKARMRLMETPLWAPWIPSVSLAKTSEKYVCLGDRKACARALCWIERNGNHSFSIRS
jgi:hypothetical protein